MINEQITTGYRLLAIGYSLPRRPFEARNHEIKRFDTHKTRRFGINSFLISKSTSKSWLNLVDFCTQNGLF